jgi:hypothetical protein
VEGTRGLYIRINKARGKASEGVAKPKRKGLKCDGLDQEIGDLSRKNWGEEVKRLQRYNEV